MRESADAVRPGKENSSRTLLRGGSKDESFVFVKGLIFLLAGLVMFCILFFADMMQKEDSGIGVSVGISGLSAVIAAANGWMFTGVAAGIGEISFEIPVLPCVLLILGLAGSLAVVAIGAADLIRRRCERKNGIAYFALSAYFILITVLLISPLPIHTKDFFQNDTLFYQQFHLSSPVFIVILFAALAGAFQFGITQENYDSFKRYAPFYVMLIIPVSLIVVFCIYPIFLQTIMSFKDYRLSTGIWGSRWVGLQHFVTMFSDGEILYVLWNTVYISLLKIIVSIVFPLLLAIILFDISAKLSGYRKVVQTLIYIPHFFSWVVVYAIAYAFLNNEGVINALLEQMGLSGKGFLTSERYFITIQLVTFGWKEIGWGTIIYYAALMNIDGFLFDAAKVDGAGPVKRLAHITIPSILPVIVFMSVLSLGNVLKTAGGEQLLLFYNVPVRRKALVIDTWLYFRGLSDLEYGLGSAMSFFQSFIGILLVLGCNWFSKKFTDRAIW